MKETSPSFVVLKVGGALLENPSHIDALSDLARAHLEAGDTPLIVHGGGPEIARYQESLGLTTRKFEGLRITTEESMRVVSMVLCGLINKRVVARFVARGLPALGISGIDLGLLEADFLDEERLGLVGGTPRVRVDLLRGLLAGHVVPVVAPVSRGPDGQALNVNADTAALAIATALPANALEFVTDVPGVRLESREVARRLSVSQASALLDGSIVSGGMLPKLKAALAAIDARVGRVRIGDIRGILENTATEIYCDSGYDTRYPARPSTHLDAAAAL